jgi:hypothetical protein
VSGRGIALCVVAALTLVSAAGLAAAAVMSLRKAPGGAVVLVAGSSAALGLQVTLGWIWWLSGGTVS